MTTKGIRQNIEQTTHEYREAYDMYVRCVNDPAATYRDMAECCLAVDAALERLVGWYWSAYRRHHGKVRPIRLVRLDVQIMLTGVASGVDYGL